MRQWRFALLALFFFGLLFALPALAVIPKSVSAAWIQEVLVNTTATEMGTRLSGRRGVTLLNRGPNSIFCSLQDSTKAVLNKSYEVKSGGEWPLNAWDNVVIYCLSSALQVTGAATIMVQAK